MAGKVATPCLRASEAKNTEASNCAIGKTGVCLPSLGGDIGKAGRMLTGFWNPQRWWHVSA